MTTKEMERWELQEGVKFLEKIGVRPAHHVLDFGARVGHYAIPAAKVVGPDGVVYAVDKDRAALAELERKADALALSTISTVATTGELKLDLPAGSIDVALLYDVLHYFQRKDRTQLFAEIAQLLKSKGLLSVYPKHTSGDAPLMELKEVTSQAVTREVEAAGFVCKHEICGNLSHDDHLEEGCVLNFRKVAAHER